jgi:hypothetical protein
MLKQVAYKVATCALKIKMAPFDWRGKNCHVGNKQLKKTEEPVIRWSCELYFCGRFVRTRTESATHTADTGG